MGVPTNYVRLLADERLDRERCARVRLFTSGSAPLLPSTFDAFAARTGHTIVERYGMTETGIITSNPLDGERRAGTVGHALPGVEVRVVGDDGATVEPGATGIVEVRGPNVFPGYWQRADATAAAFRPDGYFVTGDVGLLDEAGRLTLVGRAGDLIISGGYNVYPKEIEAELDEMPGVVESAVVGVPHPDLGETVVAVIVGAAPSLDAVRAHLEGRLARFKHPRAVIAVDELPRNAMGKVQKNVLRQEHEHLFG
jgi:malonyl-CoA/methylmalonyl-CoA synthetase